MRREILTVLGGICISGCCPAHDKYPNDTYKNSRSKRARARDKAKEHRYTRRRNRQELRDGKEF